MAALTLPVREGIVARRSTPGPLCITVPGFLVINGPQTIGITQLCYSIHFRTSNNGQAATIWHNWAPSPDKRCLLFPDVCCRDGICSELLFLQIWIFLLIINEAGKKSRQRKIFQSLEFLLDKLSPPPEKKTQTGRRQRLSCELHIVVTWSRNRNAKALGWLWYFHPSLSYFDLDSIKPGGQRYWGRGGHFPMLTLALPASAAKFFGQYSIWYLSQ